MSTSDGSKPLDVQIGGDHYKSMAIQPMEYSMANKLDACQHTIIKYVTRFREKGGIQDLEKAKHCIDLLIHFERQSAALSFVDEAREFIEPTDVEPASAIDDDSERMQIIGQSGEMASEVYAAVYGAPSWNDAPAWAQWLAQDSGGRWHWFECPIYADSDYEEWYEQEGFNGGVERAGESEERNENWSKTMQARPVK